MNLIGKILCNIQKSIKYLKNTLYIIISCKIYVYTLVNIKFKIYNTIYI